MEKREIDNNGKKRNTEIDNNAKKGKQPIMESRNRQ